MTTQFGTDKEYYWFQSQYGYLSKLVNAVPELVVGKHVAITSINGGAFLPTADQIRAGWAVSEDIAYSPRIAAPIELPLDQYDEWYVFPELKMMGKVKVFVNDSVFQLQDPAVFFDAPSATEDRAAIKDAIDTMAGYQQRFWQQLANFSCESYLAEGDSLICATRNHQLIDAIRRYFNVTATADGT